MEGTRPVLVELQALTVRLASGATPRRAAVGWDSGRLAMILAVLEARCGHELRHRRSLSQRRRRIPAERPRRGPGRRRGPGLGAERAAGARATAVVLGEIALSGEIRPVAHAGLRLKEAAKLGFTSAWVPKGTKAADGLRIAEFANLRQLVEQILGR